MRIAIIGTGMVGRALGTGLAQHGHEVVVGTRDPEQTRRREEWAANPLTVMRFDEAVEGADLIVNATSGAATLDVLRDLGSALAEKVMLDVSNPLDFSAGFPPTLTVKDTDSLAEQIQRAHPEARVVKGLNTLTADLMLNPGLLPEPTTVFVASDFPAARDVVVALLHEVGWEDVIDLGALEAARGMEMWLPLWLRIMGATGTGQFNLRIVR